MKEIHPFGDFVPRSTQYLLLGSFTTKPSRNYQWFYANGRNHFWPIMERVYNIDLSTKKNQQKLFKDLKMAMSDIIFSCQRQNNSSLDSNLINIVYNIDGINNIISNHEIKKVYFSSRFVETKFKKIFAKFIKDSPKVELVYLPSPSPRYAAMSKDDKIKKYKELLPILNKN